MFKEIKKKNNIHVGYVQNFADDYLTTIHFLLKQAKDNNEDAGVFTYTLPIIIISICFLESYINDLIEDFYKSNNINNDSQNKALIKNICDDFIQLDRTSLLEKYYIILKYYRNIDIKGDKNKFYSKVTKIVDLRNLLVHDKSYLIFPTKGSKDKIVELLENQKWLNPNHNLLGPIPSWLPYLEYNNVCIMIKNIFEFYLQYSKFINSDIKPRYQDKIELIISWHPLMQNLEGVSKLK